MQLAEDAARILQYEAKITEVRDPLAGSYYVEALTNEAEAEAWKVVEEVESYGGSVGAIEAGYMQEAVSRSAVERTMALQTGERVVVGVNAFTTSDEIDVQVVRTAQRVYGQDQLRTAESRQREKLADLRRRRSGAEVARTLQVLESVARDDSANVMEAVVDCVRALCTVGEICSVLREVFGEYREGRVFVE